MSHTLTKRPPTSENYPDLLFNSFRSSYDELQDIWSDEPAMRLVVPVLGDHLHPDSHVLDVGAGRGRDSLALFAAGHRVTAIDLIVTPEWQTIERDTKGRVRFIEGDLSSVALPDRYDAVLDNGCLHHQHPDAYLAYLRRLWDHTVEGAWLAVSFFTPAPAVHAPKGRLWTKHDGRLTRDFTTAEACELLASAGWRVERTLPIARASDAHHYLLVIGRKGN
ncbi:methyltransferase domain-containing protein [Burkholderia sp. 4701]|nr:methyltransferase domain-containing protein [Burkholderia sp. 4701]MXN85374.1 methyltransferase domain-containing protein [Burkholderia sp. 4812]